MASAYLNIVKSGLSSGNTDIYVCPIGGQAIIKVVNIYNTTAGSVNSTVSVFDSSATVTGIWDTSSVAATTQERVLQNGEVINLEAGDKLIINAGTGTALDVIVSLLQIT